MPERKLPADGKLSHLAYLDALRGLASLFVVLVHAGSSAQEFAPGVPLSGLALSSQGALGVQMFYMVSAFTLCRSLEKRADDRHSLFPFYLRRFFRIAPLFYLVLAINTFAAGLLGSPPVKWYEILLGVFFLHGLLPSTINSVVMGGWSIAVEVSFYAILPWIYPRVRSVRASLLAFAISTPVLVTWSNRLAAQTSNQVGDLYFSTYWFPVQLPVFLLGIATYALYREVLAPWVLSASVRRQLVLSAVLLGLSPLPLLAAPMLRHFPVEVASTGFLLLILALAIHPWRLLVNRLTTLLGRVSYSMYLLHFFAVAALHNLPRHMNLQHQQLATKIVSNHPHLAIPVVAVLLAVVSLPVAIASARWIEQPGIDLGARILGGLAIKRKNRLRVSGQDEQLAAR